MKDLRIKYFIFSILAMLSIISVGFAAWVSTSESTSTTIEGMIKVDDITSTNAFISCDNISKFGIFKTGFVSDDGSITNEGIINIPLTIMIDHCKEKFSNYKNILIEINMKYDNLKILYPMSNGPTSLKAKQDNNDIQIWNNDISCIAKFYIKNFNSISDSEILTNIQFIFTINDTSYFLSNIYPTLISDYFNNKFIFSFCANLTGDKNEI